MNSNKDDTLVLGASILDLQKQEKEKERKKKQNEQMRKYLEKPGVNERIYVQRHAKKLQDKIKNLGKEDPHAICKKFGHTMAHSRLDPSCFYKCSKCNVSYCENQRKYFYNQYFCPCCHFKLRTRKTIQQKRKAYG